MDIAKIINKVKPDISKITLDLYISNIKNIHKLVTQSNNITNLDFLNNPSQILSILSNKKPHTIKNYLVSIVVLLKSDESKNKNLIEKYNDEIKKLANKIMDNYDLNEKSISQEKNWVALTEIHDLVKKYKIDNMVFTGGTALNVVNNYKIQKEFKDCNLWFDPLCEDNGNCIGVAYAYLYFEKQSIQKLQDLYIGEVIKLDESLLLNEKIKDSIELNEIIKLLNQGEVVGLVQGKAEAGPRALGNRSLLLDPTLPNAKDLMNNIKQRENFRPFACSILENKANNYFEMLNIKQSPFMMYAPQAKKLAKDTIPSLVHVDNTCRIQTINNKQNSILYNILKMFKVPVIMNTSFNLAGYPIVETFEDVLFTLRNSSLKYVYFADYKKLLIKND